MSYQLTGKIKVLGAVEQKSDTFKVRKFVVSIDGDSQYPQHVEIQASNEKCDILNTFTVGSEVTVSFNLRGREWKSPQGDVKYFNTLDAWRIDAGATSNGDASPNTVPANQKAVIVNTDDVEDGLPF